jgi:hypothetical protein
MTTVLKLLVAASLGLFLASLTEAGSAIAWGMLKPLSAILFIIFFIGQLLHKEVVAYDEECRSRTALAQAGSIPSQPKAAEPRHDNAISAPVGQELRHAVGSH